MIKTYDELSKLKTFDERFRYLIIGGNIGEETFGYDRWLNQNFYTSEEWKRLRREVIIRDEGCDLGIPGMEISGRLIVHHLNPVTKTDILQHSNILVDPNFLICTSISTHNAIHYGDLSILEPFVERHPNDTCPWR